MRPQHKAATSGRGMAMAIGNTSEALDNHTLHTLRLGPSDALPEGGMATKEYGEASELLPHFSS